MNRTAAFLVALAILAAALVMLFGGCGELADPYRPLVPAGRIQGHVSSGGLPIEAEVEARQIIAGNSSGPRFRVDVDEGGSYRVDVPAGRFIVTLICRSSGNYGYAVPELDYGPGVPDTVLVDGGPHPVEIDFRLGGLKVDVSLSHLLDGEQGTVQLKRRGVDDGEYSTYADYGRAEIVDGRLAVDIPGVLPGEYRVEVELGRSYCMCGGRTGGNTSGCPAPGTPKRRPGSRSTPMRPPPPPVS